MDETDNPFTTDVDRDRTCSISYGCGEVGKKGKRDTRGSRRPTSMYDINAGSGVLPSLYILIV